MFDARRFMNLFAGLTRAYGQYKINANEVREDGKIGGRASTIKGKVTEELWIKHIEGKTSLGIVPINDNSSCKFGAIDIDDYKLDYVSVIKKLKSLPNVQLVPCVTKSGGLHLYLFLSDWVSAKIVQKKLKEIAAAIGFGNCEIFPKQTVILTERGDVGGWISMPYFGNTRHMIDEEGKPCSKEEFLLFAENSKVDLLAVSKLKIESSNDLSDGPPCLQHLIFQKFPKGTRNDGLFNVGVYMRKAFPDSWKDEVHAANHRYMNPPLGTEEVTMIIKSLGRKNYQYSCNKDPIVNHCNAGVCKNRKYGVDEESSMPQLHSLTKFDTAPPTWFIDVDGGGRIELSTDDLQNQRRFQKRCLESLNMIPKKMTERAWNQLLTSLLDTLIVVEMPIDASAKGQLMELIERFCCSKAQAKKKEEIILGKPWFNSLNNRHYFRSSDLLNYLDRHRFKDFKIHEITTVIKNNNGEHHFWNIKGKGVNCWSLKFILRTD